MNVFPLEVMLEHRTDRPDSGSVEERRDKELAVVEEPLDSLVLFDPFALVAVAQELLDPGFHRGGDIWALAFDDHDRDAVHEEDGIRDRVVRSPRDVDPELVN